MRYIDGDERQPSRLAIQVWSKADEAAAELEELTKSQGWVDELSFTAEQGAPPQQVRESIMSLAHSLWKDQWGIMRYQTSSGLEHVTCNLFLVAACVFCSLTSETPQLYGQVGRGRHCGKAKNRVLGAHKQPGVSTSVLHMTRICFVSTSKCERSCCDTLLNPSTVCHSLVVGEWTGSS